jgi:hypothetical protein
MRIRVAFAAFLLLSLGSVASMNSPTPTRPMLVAGGNPIPCWPPADVCSPSNKINLQRSIP